MSEENRKSINHRKRKLLFGVLGWSLSIILVLGMVRAVPLKDVWSALRQVDPLFFLLAMFFSSLNLWLRGGRWAKLFLPHYKIAKKSASALVMVSLAINAVLPGRIGEFVRIGMAANKFKTGIIFTTATVVLERMLDAITLLAFLGFSLFFLPKIEHGQSVEMMGHIVRGETLSSLLTSLSVISILLASMLIGLALPRFRGKLNGLASRVPIISEGFKKKCKQFLENFASGINTIKNPMALLKVFSYSACIWFALVISNLCISIGMTGINLTLLQAVVVTSISIAVSSIPSAPGAWGVFEAGALLSMMLIDMPFEHAEGVAYVFVIHLSQYLPVVFWGLISVIKEHVTYRSLKEIK